MPSAAASTVRVALIGNPNTGKSTLFTALAGVRQHVGNYPGVTVEKKTGWMGLGPLRCELVDLPGLYSLAPRSRDEMVAVDVLLGRSPGLGAMAAVVCVVDAGNLERNLYLVSQVLELGVPAVVAVNMTDLAARRGIRLNLERLQERLGVPVVAVQANRRIGIDRLRAALVEVIGRSGPEPVACFPAVFEEEVDRLDAALRDPPAGQAPATLPRPLLRRLLLSAEGHVAAALLPGRNGAFDAALASGRGRLTAAGCEVPAIETTARYGWARRMLEGVVVEPDEYLTTTSDRIDRLLTHRVFGTAVFAVVMFGVFQAVFAGAAPAMGAIDAAVSSLGQWVEAHMAEGALRSLLVDGVVGGVGSVLSFLPQILILFFFIALLEDCGYMARAAYLMDRLMVRVGLSGKSFIPMLSSFACTVPGIMATRVIEDERDRLTTILVAPLLTCSARLPVYALLIAAFVPDRGYVFGLVSLQGLTLAALYVLGIAAAVTVALVLKRTLLRGTAPPFLLEMPSYKWPSPRTVAARVGQRGLVFVRCAGTMILAVSILVWAALYYPHDRRTVATPLQQQAALRLALDGLPPDSPERGPLAARAARLDEAIEAEYQRSSILGHLGRLVEPVVRPLGWDWRIGCAVMASFPAREIVVATMGVMYQSDEDAGTGVEQGATHLQASLRAATWPDTGRPVFSLPVALSIMVFFALCAQCAATLAVIRRETNSWRWPLLTFGYMTVLAYLGALVTYQAGTWLGRFFGA